MTKLEGSEGDGAMGMRSELDILARNMGAGTLAADARDLIEQEQNKRSWRGANGAGPLRAAALASDGPWRLLAIARARRDMKARLAVEAKPGTEWGSPGVDFWVALAPLRDGKVRVLRCDSLGLMGHRDVAPDGVAAEIMDVLGRSDLARCDGRLDAVIAASEGAQ